MQEATVAGTLAPRGREGTSKRRPGPTSVMENPTGNWEAGGPVPTGRLRVPGPVSLPVEPPHPHLPNEAAESDGFCSSFLMLNGLTCVASIISTASPFWRLYVLLLHVIVFNLHTVQEVKRRFMESRLPS